MLTVLFPYAKAVEILMTLRRRLLGECTVESAYVSVDLRSCGDSRMCMFLGVASSGHAPAELRNNNTPLQRTECVLEQ